MSVHLKDKLIGVVVTMISSAIMFMAYTFIGSFETKASSETKFQILNHKIDIMLCYMDKKYCFKEK